MATTETTYTKSGADAKLATKADYPTGGTDGQALVKAGTTTAWTTIVSGGAVADASTTAKGVVQLAGDLAGTAAAPALKGILGSAGTVGSSTLIPVISYDVKGRITAISTVGAATGSGGATNPTTQSVTGTTYSLSLTDAGNIVEQNSTNALVVSVPLNATVAFPVGTVVEFLLYGTGSITLQGVSGVVLNGPAGRRLTTRYASAAIRKRATDEWIVSGYTVV